MANREPIKTSSETLRILLWDIDGTLIRSARTGAFKDYTIPMLEGVFGTSGRLAEMKVSGMTDLQIVAEALRPEGFTHEHIRERIDNLPPATVRSSFKSYPGCVKYFRRLPIIPVINPHS